MQKWLISAVIALGFANTTFAQSAYDAKVRAYIEKYKTLAVSEQQRSGIPASITLAQGIHETQAGGSELATMANNHFGIKCKKEWTGATFAHTDDAPNECFRKYDRSEDSYKDHSDYLVKSPRYASLFKLSITDYPAWAIGLRKCGYATNPKYAQVLIKLVEDYHLQEFTYAAMDNAEIVPNNDPVLTADSRQETTTPVAVVPVAQTTPVAAAPVAAVTTAPAIVKQAVMTEETPTAVVQTRQTTAAPQAETAKPPYGKEVKVNGLRAIYGRKGETPLGYAYNAGVRYAKLMDVNEIDERPLPVDMYLYLERKNTRGVRPTHTVKEGETLFMVAQEEGMQIKSLMEMNMLQLGEEPATGAVLELQQQATVRPELSLTKKAITAPVKTIAARPTQPVPRPFAAPKPVRASRIVVSENDIPPAPVTKVVQPAATVPVAEAPVPAVQEVAKSEPAAVQTVPPTTPAIQAEPIAISKQEPIAAANNTVSAIQDPTQEETNKGYPAIAEPRYAVTDAPASTVPVMPAAANTVISDAPEAASAPPAVVTEVVKPEPVKELPITETPAAMATTPVKEKTEPVAVIARTVEVPVQEEEPKDELDKLKRKFDRVVYANEKKTIKVTSEVPVTPPAPVAEPVPASLPMPTTSTKAETTKTTPVAAAPRADVVIPPGEENKYYTVKKGDTGFTIARKNNITLTQLMEWNNMDFGNVDIREGQKLKIKK